ncbi:MAG: hypothetical protein ABJA02_00670 [Acidobacteriota bacterium]
MDIFNRIGDEIESLWRDRNYDEAAFPALAADALRRADIPSQTNVWDVAEWAIGEMELPRQRDLHARFGDPPVTIYSAPRFHIDVYFWFNGTTSIHQHAFCGAFQVLHGSSIHSWYDFECENKINTFMETGRMSLRLCELLEVGAVQEIQAGKDYIHGLFHLDHPSATIVVRTDLSPLHLPQYNYYKPSLAVDPFFEQETSVKKKQLLSAMVRAKHADADRLIDSLLGRSDLQTTFDILSSLRHLLKGDQLSEIFDLAGRRNRFDACLDAAITRHGAAAEVLRDVFERQELIDEIVIRRQFATDPEHRFFLALLMNVDGREPIFELIRRRFPDKEPIEKVLDWTYDLATTRIAGGEKANVLGIADFGDVDISVLEQMLLGLNGDEIAATLSGQLGPSASGMTAAIAEKEARIRNAGIFRPLFA